MPERRLGRGLDFLISRTSPAPLARAVAAPVAQVPVAPPAPPTGPRMLALDTIQPNPQQPRVEFEPGALADLEASIREHGVLQPIVVRPSGRPAPWACPLSPPWSGR